MDEVGTRLKDARTAKNLSLEDIAYATKIPRTSLAHLEEGRYEALPAPVFVRGFIRAYARVVALDANTLVRMYEAQLASTPAAAPAPSIGAPSVSYGPRAPSARGNDGGRSARSSMGLDPSRKLVPLTPVSDRREGGFRGGYTLLAVVAVGLLVAAWLLVGGKPTGDSQNAGLPNAPVMHERIDGVPTLDNSRSDASTNGANAASRPDAGTARSPR